MVTVIRVHDDFGKNLVNEIEECMPDMEFLLWNDNYKGLLSENFSGQIVRKLLKPDIRF